MASSQPPGRDIEALPDLSIWTVEVSRGMGKGLLKCHIIRILKKGARWMLFLEVSRWQVKSCMHACMGA